GAVLRSPFDEPAPPRPIPAAGAAPLAPVAKASAATPDYLKSIFSDAMPVDPADPNARRALNTDDIPDINRDLQITPAAGPWLILVISYPGKDGPAQARKMCLELRNKNRAPAYVFVKGAEERRKE